MSASRAPQVSLDPNLGLALGLSPAERRLEESRAIDALVQKAPESKRADLRKLLARDDLPFSGAGDAETARLLEVIVAMRAANNGVTSLAAATSGSLAADSAIRNAVVVRVALVPALSPEDQGARAVVRRQPRDGGRPLLLLPEETATPADFHRGIRAAVATYARYGVGPSRPV